MAWPTTNDPRTEFVTLRLTVSEAADLDLYADSRGLSRSAAVRDAVSRVISAEQKRARRAKKPGSKPGGRVAERED
jgi:hypothetical protein